MKNFIVTALPLYHIFTDRELALTFRMIGASNLLIANLMRYSRIYQGGRNIRSLVGDRVNTLFNALLNNADFAKLGFQPYV